MSTATARRRAGQPAGKLTTLPTKISLLAAVKAGASTPKMVTVQNKQKEQNNCLQSKAQVLLRLSTKKQKKP